MVKHIFKKEMLDILRDKKTLFMMIILPVILYPVMIVAMGQVMSMSMNSIKQKDINIAFNNTPGQVLVSVIEKVNDEREKDKNQEIGKFEIVESKNYKEDLDDGKIDAYIEFKKDNDKENYTIYINSSKETSSMASEQISNVLSDYKREVVENKLSEANIDVESTLEPVLYESVDLAKNEEIAGNLLGQILPFILIIGVLLGAIYPAIDVMAGEKERGTLETLFTLPITNLELVMGKYLAVSFCAIVSAILNVFSILLTMGFMLTSAGMASELGMSNIDFGQLVFPLITTLVCICLFAMVVSAVSMCVCSLAKSFKDAQNYITPVMLLVMIPSYVSMIPNITLNNVTATIPVVNISLLIKSVLTFKSNVSLIALVLISNFAFVILSVLLLSKMFNSEEILFGSSKSFSFLEKRSNIKKGTMPSISDGVILYALGLVLLIYVGTLVQMKFGIIGIGLTQVMIIGFPLLFAYYIKTDFKKTFSIKAPSIRHLLGGAILWMGGFIVVTVISQLLLHLFPQNMEVAEGLSKALFMKESFILNLFVIAIMPAVCEEMFFRGFVLTSFRGNNEKKSAKTAIICSALLFGSMHMDFIRIIPTSILGVILAYSVYKSGSIFVAMLIHFLNNGIAVLVMHYPKSSLAEAYSLLEVNFSNPDMGRLLMIIVGSIVLMGIGTLLLQGKDK